VYREEGTSGVTRSLNISEWQTKHTTCDIIQAQGQPPRLVKGSGPWLRGT
jgi:hypothetical protein